MVDDRPGHRPWFRRARHRRGPPRRAGRRHRPARRAARPPGRPRRPGARRRGDMGADRRRARRERPGRPQALPRRQARPHRTGLEEPSAPAVTLARVALPEPCHTTPLRCPQEPANEPLLHQLLDATCGRAHYRCRYPNEYAIANGVPHPRSVYVREDAVLPRLDAWLGRLFDPANLDATGAALAAPVASRLAGSNRRPNQASRRGRTASSRTYTDRGCGTPFAIAYSFG